MGVFFGTDEYRLDAKNRLFLPPRFRDALAKEKGRHFMLTTGLGDCLYLFLPSQWEALLSNNMEIFRTSDKNEERALKRFFFGNAAEAPVDSMGRILIAQTHKDYAKLRKDAAVIGVGNKAEIWDLASWKKYQKTEIAPREKKFSKIYDI